MSEDNQNKHSISLGMNNPTRAQQAEFEENTAKAKNIVTLYSQDFVEESVWGEICDQLGLDVSKVDKVDLHLTAYEVNS